MKALQVLTNYLQDIASIKKQDAKECIQCDNFVSRKEKENLYSYLHLCIKKIKNTYEIKNSTYIWSVVLRFGSKGIRQGMRGRRNT